MNTACRTIVMLVLGLLADAAGRAPAMAHPHAWIDLRSTVILNPEGHVAAIEQEWLFDEFYTAYATEDLNGNAADTSAILRALARTNLENLKPYGYYTEVYADGARVALGTVAEFDTALRGGRLWFRFVVPLDTPIDPRRQDMVYAIFDPTYYIEMLHLEGEPVAFRGPGAAGCIGRIQRPDPPLEAVLRAAALDRDAEADDTLGALFAERVAVTCR